MYNTVYTRYIQYKYTYTFTFSNFAVVLIKTTYNWGIHKAIYLKEANKHHLVEKRDRDRAAFLWVISRSMTHVR